MEFSVKGHYDVSKEGTGGNVRSQVFLAFLTKKKWFINMAAVLLMIQYIFQSL